MAEKPAGQGLWYRILLDRNTHSDPDAELQLLVGRAAAIDGESSYLEE
jgi:hypothetical protein